MSCWNDFSLSEMKLCEVKTTFMKKVEVVMTWDDLCFFTECIKVVWCYDNFVPLWKMSNILESYDVIVPLWNVLKLS